MSNTPGGMPALPQGLADALASAYSAPERPEDTDRLLWATDLTALVRAGEDAGWPIEAMAEVVGISPKDLRGLAPSDPPADYEPPAVTVLPRDCAVAVHEAHLAYRASTPRTEDHKRTGAALADIIHAAHVQKWPLPYLSEFCGVTAERIRQILKAYGPSRNRNAPKPDVPVKFPAYERPRRRPTQRKSRRESFLTPKEAAELLELSEIARKNTGSRPLNSPERRASKAFSARLMKYHERGVVWGDLAEASGLTISGVRMRAARHGYGNGTPPTVQPYRNISIHPPKRKSRAKSAERETKAG